LKQARGPRSIVGQKALQAAAPHHDGPVVGGEALDQRVERAAVAALEDEERRRPFGLDVLDAIEVGDTCRKVRVLEPTLPED
jgi:hypothetical protein